MDEAAAELVRALECAAELEHAVLLQYLFAAASLKRRPDEGVDELGLERIRGWEATLLLIAREEMAHLAAVSNLLIAVGSTPFLACPGLPGGPLGRSSGQEAEALVLERFGARSLGRFIALEREQAGAGAIAGQYATVRREILRLEAAGRPVVRRTPVDRVGGWGVSGAARLPAVSDVAAAIAVIDAIVGQGGGPAPDTHLARLLAIEADLAATAPAFDPARRVVAAAPGAPPAIGEPLTAAVAGAFAAAYQATMLLLELYYVLIEAGGRAATGARRAARGLMTGILRPLGELLAELPVGDAAPGWCCGPAFAWDPGTGLAEERAESWRALEARLSAAGEHLLTLSRRRDAPGRLGLLGENLVLAARLVARTAGEDG